MIQLIWYTKYVMSIYKIADLYISVSPRYEFTKEYLKAYQSDSTYYDFEITITDEMLEYEKKVSLEENTEKYYEPMAILRVICDKLTDYDGFFLHSSTLMYKDNAYVFIGESGTGKSTHARLWREYLKDEVRMINDDKPIIRKKDDLYYIYGTPYMGKHNIGNNISFPIKAVFLLEQSKDNKLEKLDAVKATTALLHQTIIPNQKESMEKLLTMFNELLKQAQFYKLKCNISYDAVKTILNNLEI